MNYSLTRLATIEACDQKLAEINLDKEDLTVKKVLLVRKHTSAEVTSPAISAEITALEIEIAGLEAAIATYPEGYLKETYVLKRNTKLNRLNLLNQRLEGFNDGAILDQEYDVNCIDRSLLEVEAFIAAINARKSEL